MQTVAITVLELLLVYAIPIAVAILLWLGASLAVYLVVRFGRSSALRADFLRRIERKQRLRSGRNARLGYGYVARLLLGDNCVQATVLYRVSRVLARKRLRGLAQMTHAFSKLVTHVDVSPWAEIGPGLFLYHGLGTVVGKGTRLGSRALVCQNVTTGGGPVLGDDVKLWAGAKVIGRITVGDRVEVGANAVVLADVPSDAIAVGVPARVLERGASEPLVGALVEPGRDPVTTEGGDYHR